ncbi:MAG: 3-phosphoshikimate 1-carboxyvinyltransferase [Spirosomaceae bacterium]|nr:3-phosphoshikimate 1-carboxyvinyltransferase [Spirosomataceae bacterium]
MSYVQLRAKDIAINDTVFLPSSKSESNRSLIINALCNPSGKLSNLSSARDTQTMMRLLASNESVADVIDAGTTMRFLTAYFAVTNQQKTLTGTPRMCERPIGILVEALTQIGVEIKYEGVKGYPPHQILGLEKQQTSEVTIPGNVSSQYISALLMVAPVLPDGLKITLTGEIGSIPYITMTIELMKSFGVNVEADWENKTLTVASQKYQPTEYAIESDWSGASYWYSVVALSYDKKTTLQLNGLKENSLQGDSKIVEIMERLGVKSEFNETGVKLSKIPRQGDFSYDFANCPDLVQTVAVVCALEGIDATFTGIESLKIKETDRVFALQTELVKLGVDFMEVEKNHKYRIAKHTIIHPDMPFDTYDDHRMAMAFAPIAMQMDIVINEPNVVVKSYPSFWEDFAKVAEVAIS